jgi:ubiquinone/menaquinone biosynthesis C-methylase UbiE
MSENLKSPTYLLPTGKADLERLSILNEIVGEYTKALFDKMELKKGQKVAIFGCGSGEGIECIHQKIGDEGKLLCIDICLEQIEVTREVLAKKGIFNVEYQVADIQNVQGDEDYDLAYCRYVLIHVEQPRKAIENMLSFVKHGGLISFEEHSTGIGYCYPKLEVFSKMLEIRIKWEKAFKNDRQYGEKLYHEMLNFDVEPIDFQVNIPIFNSFRKKQFMITSWESLMKNEKINKFVPEEEIALIVSELKKHQNDTSCFQSAGASFQYLGRKN